MQLIIVRHAIALDREEAKQLKIKDSHRPLTPKGIKKFTTSLKNKKKLFKNVTLYITSDYLRAQQSLEMVLLILNTKTKFKVKKLTTIRPYSKPGQFKKYLLKSKVKKIVIVSHEPFLSALIEELNLKVPKKIKKGAVLSFKWKRNA